MSGTVSKITSAITALAIATLSGLGVGSGGLLVIFLTLFEGISPATARGMNLLFFIFSASAAFIVHLFCRRIDLRSVAMLALFAAVGTVIGTCLGIVISPDAIKHIFGAMLMLAGGRTLISRLREHQKNIVEKSKKKASH